jgi:hypothetical protein
MTARRRAERLASGLGRSLTVAVLNAQYPLNRAPATHSETTGSRARTPVEDDPKLSTGSTSTWKFPGCRALENNDSKKTGRVAREQAAGLGTTPSRSWFSKEAEPPRYSLQLIVYVSCQLQVAFRSAVQFALGQMVLAHCATWLTKAELTPIKLKRGIIYQTQSGKTLS